MKFQRSLKAEVSIDLTPLIDVVFLLLIFFMVTTTFSRDSNLLVNLPEASGQAVEETPFRIDILVARNGQYSINGQALQDTSIDSLIAVISELAAGDGEVPISITADADTTHQSVVRAMDAVSRLGFRRLSIATRQVGAEEE